MGTLLAGPFRTHGRIEHQNATCVGDVRNESAGCVLSQRSGSTKNQYHGPHLLLSMVRNQAEVWIFEKRWASLRHSFFCSIHYLTFLQSTKRHESIHCYIVNTTIQTSLYYSRLARTEARRMVQIRESPRRKILSRHGKQIRCLHLNTLRRCTSLCIG